MFSLRNNTPGISPVDSCAGERGLDVHLIPLYRQILLQLLVEMRLFKEGEMKCLGNAGVSRFFKSHTFLLGRLQCQRIVRGREYTDTSHNAVQWCMRAYCAHLCKELSALSWRRLQVCISGSVTTALLPGRASFSLCLLSISCRIPGRSQTIEIWG